MASTASREIQADAVSSLEHSGASLLSYMQSHSHYIDG